MPALVKSKVGSLNGTTGDEGTIRCSLALKKSRNEFLISLEFNIKKIKKYL